MPLPEYRDVAAAATRLKGHAHLTPLLSAPVLDLPRGGTLFAKAENLQIGGAFKFRGAYNRLVQLDSAERACGVVAWSSGNHGQGVAAAGARLGVRVTIVMPRDAPTIKIANTRRLGAEVVFYDRLTENREAIARELADRTGAILVPSYDDPDIIAGQGTVALEAVAQARDLYGVRFDKFLVPCGGGGLVAGCALALAQDSPATKVYAVEPEGYDDTVSSLASGKWESVIGAPRTLCDALMATTPGRLTFAINRGRLAGGLVVSDDEVLAAMAFAWRELKLVIEPGGAVALAAALSGRLSCEGEIVGLVLSGGNVDLNVQALALGLGGT